MVFLLKDKNGITTTNAFQKYWHRSSRKPSKIWVDEGSAFYNEVMVPDNGTEIIQHTRSENVLLQKELSEL